MYKIYDFKQKSKKIHKIYKIIQNIFYIIIMPIIIINITLIIKTFINPEEIPDFLGFKNFIIVSQSMEPNIKVGDAIFIKEVEETELKVNDIISFHDGADINTHRIKDIVEENGKKVYTTKGDNNKREDKNKITYKDIEGKYLFQINNFGIIAKILKSKITLIMLLIFVTLSIIFNYRIYKRQQKRDIKRRNYEKIHQLQEKI